MPAPRKRPDDETLLRLREEGLTDREIGEKYDLNPVYVNELFRQLGVTDPVFRYDTYVPWTVKHEHRNAPELRALWACEQIEILHKDERDLPSTEASARRTLLRELERDGTVVAYTRPRGFHRLKRVESDGVMPIRVP